MKSRLALGALVVSGLLLAACGSDDDGGDGGGSGDAPTAADLDGRAFTASEIDGHDIVEDSSITINFSADSMSANAGCNTLVGGYTIDDGALTAGPFAMTEMACDPALMDQDTWLGEFLAASPEVTLDGDTLTLSGADATIELSEVADAQLDGIEWKLTGTIENDAVASVPEESTASIGITDATIAVDTGCNTGTGGVEVGDGTLTFQPIATTRKACDEPVMAIESAMLAVLEGEATFEIAGDTLVIRSADGATGLQFAAVS